MSDYILEVKSEYAKLFSDKARRKIVEILARDGELTVTQLATRLGITKATVSHHLKRLAEAGVVEVARIEATRGIPKKYFRLSKGIIREDLSDKYAVIKDKIEKEFENLLKHRKKRSFGDEVNISFVRMYKSALLLTGYNLDRILRDEGYELGYKIFASAIDGESLKDVLENIREFWEEQKLGRIEIVDISDKSATIRVEECYQCMEMPEVGKPLCSSDEGVLQGILEAKLQKRYNVQEVKCWGTGYTFCEFKIQEIPEQT